jgi:N-methylhydantoinase A
MAYIVDKSSTFKRIICDVFSFCHDSSPPGADAASQGVAIMKPIVRPRSTRLAADIGGTFTDIVLESNDRRWTKKVLTTPARPEQAVIDGARQVLAQAGLSFADVKVFVHGTTLATNAVLERRGARTALITTEGFRDILEIGTEGRFDQYDLQIERRAPLVPRSLRLTVPERLNAQGKVVMALDRAALEAQIPLLQAHAVTSVAVCFLHAYANPVHEKKAREILLDALPALFVSLSSEVCPEIREYERTCTTVANAYVQPQMSDYLERMEQALDADGFSGALYLVTSNGGLTSLATARRHPVRLIESGPAGGAIFAADVAATAGERKVAAFDMGGTTAKICLIEDFSPDGDRVYEVDRAARFLKGSGMPLRIPVIDLVEIGAGGGSIARVNSLRNVEVGPRSAGSVPGPACYGRGGTDPTVTDADAVLGLIDPSTFAGGCVGMDLGAARQALAAVAEPLGMSEHMAAYAVHEMVCESMASAARVHAIEKGKSIAGHTLIAFGGAAPLHVARVAEKTGIDRIIIPRHAGVGSAVGFLRAPVSYEVVRSRHERLADLQTDAVGDMLEAMSAEAVRVVHEGAQGATVTTRRLAFMRYVGQGHEVAVALPDRRLADDDRTLLAETFERAYAALFDRSIPGAQVEILSWSVLACASLGERDRAACAAPRAAGAAATPAGHRTHFDGRSGQDISVPVFQRHVLGKDAVIHGPALITEEETTTYVSGAFDAHADQHGNIVMQRKPQPGAIA